MIPLYDDQPTRSFPLITIVVILVNVVVFAWWQLGVGVDESVALAALVPAEVSTGQPGGAFHILSSMFMHGSWMHLLGNMWFLWIFGNNIEDICGHVRFALFYLICGAAAAGAHILADPSSTIPLVGASGAVSGVLGAYLVKHPRAMVRTLVPISIFIRIVDIPAFIFLLLWIGMQVLFEMTSQPHGGGGSGVAYLAHIGGFVAGLLLISLFQRNRERRLSTDASWSRHKSDERSW